MSCSSSFSNKKRASPIAETWEVEGNDDLLTVILVRLPARSIYRFRCVSKRWKYIISTPIFLQTFYCLRKERALAHDMVAYIQETYSEADTDNSQRRNSEFVTTVPVPSESRSKLLDEEKLVKGYYFVNSSNGLILLQYGDTSYRIHNPISTYGVEVVRQEPLQFSQPPAMALVCEENMHDLVRHYKIVLAAKDKEEHSYLTINTFCSKTGKWMSSTPTATGSLNDVLHRYSTTLVVDGIIHWFTHTRLYLVVYYMENKTIQLADLPSECGQNYSSRVARSSRDDDLWLCLHMANNSCIKFWMLPSSQYESYRSRSSTIPSDAWILMHEFTYQAPPPARTEEILLKKCLCRSWWRGGVRCRVPPYVDFYISKHCDPQIYSRYEFYPFMEALTLSSYAF